MNIWFRNSLLLVLMLAASGIAMALRPTHKIADQGPQLNLETMIPHFFGDWHEEKLPSAQIVDPQQQEIISLIYSQTLDRTYVNSTGYRIMLTLAYGTNQGDSMQVHKPEICYPAQGFVLESKKTDVMTLGNAKIPVTRILATKGPRSEPVTYWTTVGDHVVRTGINKKLIEMSYGLTGKIPDGMLIRVSSIDPETNKAYEIQDRFSAQLLESIPAESRQRLIGSLQLN